MVVRNWGVLITPNGSIICVRWGVTPPKIINSTKLKNMQTDNLKNETTTDANNVLPAVFSSIEEAVKELGLSKRVKWKNYLGYLCRYTKKDICPEFVVKDGLPVQINGR